MTKPLTFSVVPCETCKTTGRIDYDDKFGYPAIGDCPSCKGHGWLIKEECLHYCSRCDGRKGVICCKCGIDHIRGNGFTTRKLPRVGDICGSEWVGITLKVKSVEIKDRYTNNKHETHSQNNGEKIAVVILG